ncbi:MAG TPA: VCBS repeat-containing protein, partial [Planctomycetaceae bacterium]|nr:VCBS repeat-containing protein [Planctomycetaceae bacterium]
AIVGRNVQSNQWQMTWSVGSGMTTAPISIWGTGSYADAFIADLNRDGREEIVARQVQTGKWFALGSLPTAIRTDPLGAWPAQSTYDTVQQGDFNGDLLPDWIGHDAVSGAWRSMTSVGTGGYTVMELAAPAFGYVATETGVADYDLDGRLDVLSRDATTGNRLLVSVVNGALNARPYSDWTAYGNSWADTLTLDFNGDGDSDLLARDASSGNWWLTTFVATTPTTRKVAQWTSSAAWQNRFTLDFDGNGSSDVLARDPITGNWHLLRMVDGIATSTVIANWSPGVTWTDFQVADLMGNGRPMIVARNATTNLWQGLWSSGSGFTTASLRGLAAGQTYVDTRVVRFFGDSREAVVTRDSQTGAWYAMWYGNAWFNLTPLGTWDPSGSWENVAVADLEADGRQELYGHDARSGQTWRLAFNGTTATNTVIAVSPMNQNLDLATAGRFTNSGRQSLLVRDPATSRWYALQFNGLLYGYTDLGVWSETASWTSTRVADFNRDGRHELVGYSTATSTWTARGFDSSNWVQTTVSSLPVSARVGDVPGASNATLRATILRDVPELAAAVAVRDVHTMAELLRNWVANAADSTLYSNPLMSGTRTPAESFYKYYVPDLAGSSCGGFSEFFIQVLKLFQIDSLTIGLGDETADLLHATVVVPILSNGQWRFEFFDPTFNCSFDNSWNGRTATYFDLVDAARSGFSTHLQLNEAATDNRRFISAVPISDPDLVLERFANGVYVYRWPGYGIDDYLDQNHDALVNNGYSPGLHGFYQLLPQVKSVFANNGSGNPSTSNSQRTAFLVELATRGIAVS